MNKQRVVKNKRFTFYFRFYCICLLFFFAELLGMKSITVVLIQVLVKFTSGENQGEPLLLVSL